MASSSSNSRIAPELIQLILAKTDIVELVQSRVPLKKSGKNFSARCPFHNEKTPSFHVSRDRQTYHCYGCEAHGNAIDFLREYDRLDFIEAVRTLADAAGVDIVRESPESGNDREAFALAQRLYDIQDRAALFYQRQLKVHPEAARAVEYLKSRGLTGELAQRYRLGYAPPDWRNLPAGFARPALQAAGLAIAGEGKDYDRFRDRIMFPIRDRRGRVVGFGGRVLGDDTPKYLNSPETPVFRKHREVYGLFEILQSRAKLPRIIVVEGYMDVIALAQHGFPFAVATLGTATSPEHFELLFREVNELVICFDGDAAGRNAAWKSLEAVIPSLREGRSCGFLMLPEGYDPDSLVRLEGPEHFSQRLEGAIPFSQYLITELRRRENLSTLNSLEQRVGIVSRIRPLIEKLPSGSLREEIEKNLANLVGEELLEGPRQRQKRRFKDAVPQRDMTKPPSLLRVFMAILVQNPQLAAGIGAEERHSLMAHPRVGRLLNLLFEVFELQAEITPAGILEAFRGTPEEELISNLLWFKTDIIEADMSAELTEVTFKDVLSNLSKQIRTERMEQLIQKSRNSSLTAVEKEELRNLSIQ